MYLQGVDSVYDLIWADGPFGTVTYGDVFHQNEVEQSTYNFEHANVPKLFELFDFYERSQPADGRRAAAAGLRDGGQGLAHLQPARCPSRHFGHRAPAVHPARAQHGRSIAQSYLLARAKLGFPMATPELRDEVLAKLEAAE